MTLPSLVATSEASDATIYASRKIVRISDGTLYAIYCKKLDTMYQVYIKYSVDSGATWTGEMRISTYAGMQSYFQTYPSIAVDSNDHLHVVWMGKATGYTSQTQIWYAEYTDSWQTPVRLSTYDGMITRAQQLPAVAVDSNNHRHVVWEGRATGYTNVWQIWYAEYTTSWQTPVRISTSDGMATTNQLRPTIAIDSINHRHVVWDGFATGYTEPGQGQIWYAEYTTSWQTPVRISTLAGMESYTQGLSDIAIDSNDYPHATWRGTISGYSYQIWHTKRTGSWQTPVRISTYSGMESYAQVFPSIAIDSNDHLHVMWCGKAAGYTDYDKVWYATYIASWATPIILQVTGQNRYPSSRWSRHPTSNHVTTKLDYLFMEGTASPYNVKFDALTIADPPPVAMAGPDQSGDPNETLNFDGSASYAIAPATTIDAYDWNWGDGTAHGSGATPTHAYTLSGNYVVTLTVTDNLSATGIDTLVVSIGTSESISNVMIEIFSNPCLFDDHFVNNWTAEGGAVVTTDGDIVQLKCGGDGDYSMLRTLPTAKNTNPYRYLTVWARALTGASWAVKVFDGATLKVSKTYTDTGVKEIDLYAENGNVHFSYDLVRLWISGTIVQYAQFDYIVISDEVRFVPTVNSDIIDELVITRPILSRGIAGLKARIFNPDGSLTGKAAEYDVILAYMWRMGETQTKVFGGKIVAPGSDASFDDNEYYITIDAHDHGWELNRPPSLVDAVYTATGGKTIIEAAVDKCAYLTKKFVDVDSEIISTHDIEFREVTPGKVINDISEKAVDGAGNVGVDGYVDPAGNVNIFKRGKYNSPVVLTILGYNYLIDTDRIINKQRVYGEASKLYPTGADLCESLTPTEGEWTAITGSSYVYLEDTKILFGSHSIRGQLEVAGPTLMLRFTFNSGYEPDCSYPPLHRYGEIFAGIWLDDTWQENVWVVLSDDAGKKITRYIKAVYDDWTPIALPTGVKTVPKDWLLWPGDETFNWAKIAWVQFYTWISGAPATGSIYIDRLHFRGRRYEGEYTDPAAQIIRQAESIVEDELKSDAECLNRATGIVQFYKDPVKNISNVRVVGDNRFLPGHMQYLISTVDGISSSFRIIEIKHRIQFTYWITELILNNEPQEISYLLSALFDKIRSQEVNTNAP